MALGISWLKAQGITTQEAIIIMSKINGLGRSLIRQRIHEQRHWDTFTMTGYRSEVKVKTSVGVRCTPHLYTQD